jgi:gas vesicle protein
MDAFWKGFEKRASDVLDDWQEESSEESKKAKKEHNKEPMRDHIKELHSMPPDADWKSWP